MAKLVIILVASVSTYTLSRSSVLPNPPPQRSCAALKATGGAVLRGDRFAAPSYFDVHSWRSMVAVRAGVPMVSYSRAVWPIISQPPRGEHWAAAGQHQPHLDCVGAASQQPWL